MSTNTIIYIIIGAIAVFIFIVMTAAHSQVYTTYQKYSQKPTEIDITGFQFIMGAKKILKIYDLNIARTDVFLGDAYSIKKRTIILSDEVLSGNSVAAISVAAHELGHAIQHNDQDFGFQISYFLSLLTNFLLKFIIPLILTGIILLILGYESLGFASLITVLGVFVSSVVIKLVLIPVEINASKRALKFLRDEQVLSTRELIYAKKMLRVAALTYISSFFDAIFKPFKIIKNFIIG